MLTLTITEAQQLANENNCNVFQLLDIISNTKTMKLFPLQQDTMTKEFEFDYQGKKVSAECDYVVDINPINDRVEVVGEITDREEKVYEIKEKTIRGVMREKFYNEIEAIRDDLKAERKSRLKDFGARVF